MLTTRLNRMTCIAAFTALAVAGPAYAQQRGAQGNQAKVTMGQRVEAAKQGAARLGRKVGFGLRRAGAAVVVNPIRRTAAAVNVFSKENPGIRGAGARIAKANQDIAAANRASLVRHISAQTGRSPAEVEASLDRKSKASPSQRRAMENIAKEYERMMPDKPQERTLSTDPTAPDFRKMAADLTNKPTTTATQTSAPAVGSDPTAPDFRKMAAELTNKPGANQQSSQATSKLSAQEQARLEYLKNKPLSERSASDAKEIARLVRKGL
jgi:hypothetical protein